VAVRSRVLTRHQLQSSAWRRWFPDVYACASVEPTHVLRARAVTELVLPGAVASGRTAGVLWGCDLASAVDPVELTVPPGTRGGAVDGVLLTRRRLPADDVTLRAGVPVTTALRTALDLCRIRPLDDAVAVVDRFLVTTRALTVEAVRAAAADLTGRDCRHVREVVALVDGAAGSPQETRLRLLLRRSTLPDPVAQHVVRDVRRSFVARVDFAWPELRLALEYDGEWHAEPGQLGRDRRRLNRLTAAGWTVLFVTAADLHDPERLLARIAAAIAARYAAVR
jgi:very-short-patch-repair endonuclease